MSQNSESRELQLETPYLKKAISATRKAFQLDSISTRLINPQTKLTNEDLKSGESTLRNIRLWDSKPLLASNRQLQQLRVYYRFSNPSVDRLKDAPIDEILVTDTVAMNGNSKNIDNLNVVSVSSIIGEALRSIFLDDSVSEIFMGENVL